MYGATIKITQFFLSYSSIKVYISFHLSNPNVGSIYAYIYKNVGSFTTLLENMETPNTA